MNHSFDIEVAGKYGVNAAVILNNIIFWIQKNYVNNKNYHDGEYWTYNSASDFQKIFPYMSERQIRTALKKLIEDDILQTGNYNEKKYDRTIWYSFTEKGKALYYPELCQTEHQKSNTQTKKCQTPVAKMSDASDKNVTPIPDINTDINTYIKNTPAGVGDGQLTITKKETAIANNQDKGETKELLDYFYKQHGNFTNWGKEGRNAKKILEFAKKTDPDYLTFTNKLLFTYKQMINGRDRFWASQPFTPSAMLCHLDKVYNQLKKQTDEVDIEAELLQDQKEIDQGNGFLSRFT